MDALVHNATAASDIVVELRSVCKTFRQKQRSERLRDTVRTMFRPPIREVRALQQIDLQIRRGEIVAYAGPNGAGKSTTVKLLSGMLAPDTGTVRSLGLDPVRDRVRYVGKIGVVFGQRTELWMDHPIAASFEWKRVVWDIPRPRYERMRDMLKELLGIGEFFNSLTRELSLGQKMRAELGLALLHEPEILFLDEPTIGLDITAQVRIRAFLQEYNRRTGATILLTSHYMADVTALCERIIIIHHGQLKYDGAITDLARRIAPFKLIGVALLDGVEDDLGRYGTPIPNQNGDGKRLIQVQADQVAPIAARMLAELAVQDLTIEDPPIEDVIERAFHE